ncbi:hypothetical protein N431DRAFT_445372 [Stipitochalara longipes BDJ]|nr:hypothetical protein N431DRAFT_445372 [Stipitochalara longipes BDJ]
MFLSNSIVLASLALLGVASSQVVVTVTNTVTVITVTVPPLSTSTSTVIVTVNAPPPTTKSTSTRTVTVTAGVPTATAASCPIPQWGQCGGRNFQVPCGGSCGNSAVCLYDTEWWSYCSPLPQFAVATSTYWAGWHGIYASAA